MTVPAKYAYIDATRGLAVVLVIVVHAAQSVNLGVTTAPDHWVVGCAALGQAGVQLFFFASALTLALSATARREDPCGWVGFGIRRIARIVPLYSMGIIGYSLAAWFAADAGYVDPRFGQHQPMQIFLHGVYLHSWVPWAYDEVVPGGWSIGTERAFYTFFPLIYLAVLRMTPGRVFAVAVLWAMAIAGGTAIAADLWGWRIQPNSWWWCSLPAQLPVFLCAMAYWRLSQSSSLNHRNVLLGLSALALVAVPVVWRQAWQTSDLPARATTAAMLLPLCCGIIAMGVVEVLQRLTRFPRWLLSVGRASYSMYLLHFVFAWGVAGWLDPGLAQYLPGTLRLLLYVVGTTVFAWLFAQVTMRVIERPGILAGERLLARWCPRVVS